MSRILSPKFFNRDTETVARELLGKRIVRKDNRGTRSALITEVEVYDGFRDRGSHAHKGETPRNRAMFGRPGLWYPYLVYGMHWMLNITTREEGYPAAILIRSVKSAEKDIEGPGRVTKFLDVDNSLYGKPSSRTSGLWIEDMGKKVRKIIRKPRVGIHYAGPYWKQRKLRFLAEGLT